MKYIAINILFLIICFNAIGQNGYYIQTNQLKIYKNLTKALKEPDIVYSLYLSYFEDKKLKTNNTFELKKYLSKINNFNNLYSIGFDYLNISEIPSLENFKYLETITISRMNNLNWEKLFINISKCPNLKYLVICQCDSINITSKISLLKNLKSLNIGYTKNLIISDSIQYNKQLKILGLGSNELINLPKNIGLIPNLEEFSITDNGNLNFRDAFEILSNCKKLEFLDLYGNTMSELPDNISSIKSLKRLHLGSNRLKTLPMSLTEMPNLEYIIWHFGQNTLEDLPTEFNEKIKLKRLENGNYVKE